jgi:predicted RNase H-like HicB family nuclease
MISEYIQAAMKQATYELLPDGEGFFGSIPDCKGVWSNAPTLEACREELQSALEDWIIVGIWHHDVIPVVGGVDLNVGSQQEQEVA